MNLWTFTDNDYQKKTIFGYVIFDLDDVFADDVVVYTTEKHTVPAFI